MLRMLEQLKRALFGRRWAYVKTFNGADAEVVLADLARFCRANESTYTKDPDLQKHLEGRREVWLRIQRHLNLSPDELWRLTSTEMGISDD